MDGEATQSSAKRKSLLEDSVPARGSAMTAHRDKSVLYEFLLGRVQDVVKVAAERSEVLQTVCDLLRKNVPAYDWVGFYLVDPERPRELILGPFSGEKTEHVRIPFGRGICGQAAEREKMFVVQDVSKETNYLSCSLDVRAEIVVPIFAERDGVRRVVAELDVDSHTSSPFTDDDRQFLANVCKAAATLF